MKKNILIALLVAGISSSISGQVQFSKFKFKLDSPFGCCPTRKMTDSSFKITGNKQVKYIKVHYSGVNNVYDAVSSDIVGAVNANQEHTKYKIFMLTGPFEPKKKYSRYASASFYYPMKIVAFPSRIEIEYMDRTSDDIKITKENIHTFFPNVEWMDVNYDDGL